MPRPLETEIANARQNVDELERAFRSPWSNRKNLDAARDHLRRLEHEKAQQEKTA